MTKGMVSIIIPSRNEQFLDKTIKDLLDNALGDIEVIAVLDEGLPGAIEDSRVRYIKPESTIGMRACINLGVEKSEGEYIMKIDGHCMVGEGYDKILVEHSASNVVQVPTRKRLDAENWCVQDVGKPDINYMYLSYPEDDNDFGGPGLNGKEWRELNSNKLLEEDKITDLMSFQGSCWFMEKSYFYELELMDYNSYGPFWNEAQEIGLKAWLSGGKVVRNKNTWYAHLHKGKKYGRGYFLSKQSINVGAAHTRKWMEFKKAWDKQTIPLSWLIEKFSPPTWDEAKILKLKQNGN